MTHKLTGSKALVTGGTRGIGRATAERLAAEGVALALVARDSHLLQSVSEEVSSTYGVAVHPIVADLSRVGEPARAVNAAANQLGGLDILINNAGSSPFGSLETLSEQDWRASIDLKLMGYVGTTRAAFGLMKEDGGVVVNVVGMAGRFASPSYVLGALNAALLHFTKSSAELGGSHGIRVVAVNPGLTTTERMEEAIEAWASDAGMPVDEFRESYLSDKVPIGQFTKPVEIAEAIAYLCSSAAGPTTGSAIQLDGGSARGVF